MMRYARHDILLGPAELSDDSDGLAPAGIEGPDDPGLRLPCIRDVGGTAADLALAARR